MTPNEFVAMCRKLKELGATKVHAAHDGSFEAQFGGGARVVQLQQPAEPQTERDREPRVRSPEEAPADADGREAWRKSVMRSVSGGG